MKITEGLTLRTDKLSLEALKAIEEAPDKSDFIVRAIEYYVKTNVSSQLEEILEAVRHLDKKVSSRKISFDESESGSESEFKLASKSASKLNLVDNKNNQTSEEDLTDLLLEGFDNF